MSLVLNAIYCHIVVVVVVCLVCVYFVSIYDILFARASYAAWIHLDHIANMWIFIYLYPIWCLGTLRQKVIEMFMNIGSVWHVAIVCHRLPSLFSLFSVKSIDTNNNEHGPYIEQWCDNSCMFSLFFGRHGDSRKENELELHSTFNTDCFVPWLGDVMPCPQTQT